MTLTAVLSQHDVQSVRGCSSCPLARHLSGHRFACADRPGVVNSNHPATQECYTAISTSPGKYFKPLPLPDFMGVEEERICEHISLALNFLDPDEETNGANSIEVLHQNVRVGYILGSDIYSCERIQNLSSPNPHWIALHMIHPDYLYRVAEEVIATQILQKYI